MAFGFSPRQPRRLAGDLFSRRVPVGSIGGSLRRRRASEEAAVSGPPAFAGRRFTVNRTDLPGIFVTDGDLTPETLDGTRYPTTIAPGTEVFNWEILPVAGAPPVNITGITEFRDDEEAVQLTSFTPGPIPLVFEVTFTHIAIGGLSITDFHIHSDDPTGDFIFRIQGQSIV